MMILVSFLEADLHNMIFSPKYDDNLLYEYGKTAATKRAKHFVVDTLRWYLSEYVSCLNSLFYLKLMLDFSL